MLGLTLPVDRSAPLRVLALGAHSDDLEIGCGGTILRLAESVPLEITWVVLCAGGARGDEARTSAEDFLERAEERSIVLRDFRDGFLPYDGGSVKEFFEELKAGPVPDIIFTHHRFDLHQDHRLACELTWNTFRDHAILEYEVPKYDGDLGAPNVFVELDEETCARKIDLLLTHFASQRSRRWFTEDLFRSLLRVRGMECASPTGNAEAFYGRKLVLAVP